MEKLPNKQIGLVGVGRMGGALAQNLLSKNWEVAGLDHHHENTKNLIPKGLKAFYSTAELVLHLSKPRIVWLMVTPGEPVQQAMFGSDGLINYLETGDIVIDGGNSYFEDTIVSAEIFSQKKITLLDVGVGNGVEGAQFGACMMVGGERPVYSHIEELFKDLCVTNGYAHVGPTGAGHFIKMVHNAILYGYSQSIAEGFELIKTNGSFNFDLSQIAKLYNTGSLIESQLMDYAGKAFEKFGQNMDQISSVTFSIPEGQNIVKFAKTQSVDIPIIGKAAQLREQSSQNLTYQSKLVMAIRNMFGGHSINK